MDWDKERFLKTYKGTETFVTVERGCYALFLELLEDEELLSHIRFANDTLGIPPLKTFVLYERDILHKDVFREKRRSRRRKTRSRSIPRKGLCWREFPPTARRPERDTTGRH